MNPSPPRHRHVLLADELTPPPAEFAALPLPARIAHLRDAQLAGGSVVFTPYAAAYAEALRELRNLPHNQLHLAQNGPLGAEQQAAWAEAYFRRDDDLCWILLTPGGDFAGAISLYDITPAGGETGRLVLREDLARTTPMLAECELMVQWLAFGWLQLAVLRARVQPANAKMVTMHQRLGFRIAGPAEIRGVPYLALELAAADYRPEPHARVLRHWRSRARPA